MVSELVTGSAQCEVFEHSSNRLMKRKTGGVGTQFRNEPDNHLILVNGMQPTFFIRERQWTQNKMPVQIQTSTLEVNQEEGTALAHHRPLQAASLCRR